MRGINAPSDYPMEVHKASTRRQDSKDADHQCAQTKSLMSSKMQTNAGSVSFGSMSKAKQKPSTSNSRPDSLKGNKLQKIKNPRKDAPVELKGLIKDGEPNQQKSFRRRQSNLFGSLGESKVTEIEAQIRRQYHLQLEERASSQLFQNRSRASESHMAYVKSSRSTQ